jgi:hypothetical protein
MGTPTLNIQHWTGFVASTALRGARTFISDWKSAWRAHAVLQLCGAIVFLSGYIASEITGNVMPISPKAFATKYIYIAAIMVLAALIMGKFANMIIIERPKHPIAELGRWLWDLVADSKRLANGFHGMVFVFLLMGGFTMWKNLVARILGFSWDPAFAHLDRLVHFGHAPHELLMAVIGFPLATFLINMNYLAWFHVLFVACFVAAFQTNRSLLRQRFLFALLLGWTIGGCLFANLLSSAGPVFYGHVTGDNDLYAGLFRYLDEVNRHFPLTTLELQGFLWSSYQDTPSYSSISAMPSMHVTIATLIFLAVRGINRWLAWATGIFAVLIVIGSVQLGWHYAIDGYLGLAVAVLAWTIAAPIARWDLRRSAAA